MAIANGYQRTGPETDFISIYLKTNYKKIIVSSFMDCQGPMICWCRNNFLPEPVTLLNY